MYQGYIKIWRKFSETSFYQNSICVHLSLHLLMKCNHEPKKIMVNGEEINIERGQCLTNLPQLQFETKISIQSLRTALHSLSVCNFLTAKSTNRFRLISIAKYSDYQDKLTGKLTDNQQATNRLLTGNSEGIRMNKNDKNDKNDNNTTIYVEFSEFWKAYPKKVGKDKAREAWKKKTPPLKDCLKALSWQTTTDQWKKDGGQFIPHPTTWLNQGRWQDCPAPAPYVHPSHIERERQIRDSESREKKTTLEQKQAAARKMDELCQKIQNQ